MPQGHKTSILVSAAIFILLEVAALAMLDRSSTLQDIWINRASHRVMAALWSSGESVRNYFRLEAANDELALRNAALRQELERYHRADEAMRERQAAEGTLPAGYGAIAGARQSFSYTPATIVKMSRNRNQNYVIINKGSEDGIRPQSGIISSRGIIGVISSVSRHYSYGLTLMNPNVTVSTKVGPEGITAPLVWDGISSDAAVVTDIPPHYSVTPGDTVWTSGYSAIFPEGIAVGVTGESRLVDGSNQHVEVKLFQDFRSAHYVTVTCNTDIDEIRTLEEEAGKEGAQ